MHLNLRAFEIGDVTTRKTGLAPNVSNWTRSLVCNPANAPAVQ